MTRSSPPLVLLSGLGADETVFAPQKIRFPRLIVPAWPIPRRDDTLDTYASRIAEDLSFDERAIIGGASFGGIVALHLAKYVNPLAIVLIGSVRSPEELPKYAKAARWVRWLIPLLPIRLMQICVRPLASRPARRFAPHLSSLAGQFCRSHPRVFKWSLARLLDWRQAPAVDAPICHIHGRRDFVMPPRNTLPDRFVDAGGHVISLTHGQLVNDYIQTVIEEHSLSSKQPVKAVEQ